MSRRWHKPGYDSVMLFTSVVRGLNDLRDPAPAGGTSRAPSGEIESLKFEVERLLMITEALWRILKEKHGCDDTELIRQITIVDMEDGRLDGRKEKSPPKQCPKCQRTLIKNRPRCFYCAEPIAADPFGR